MYLSYGRSHTQTRKLFLIRHSVPKIDTAVDPSLWGLSETGRQRSTRVAGHLISSSALRSSGERKAVETAGIIGAELGLIPSTDNALNEHHRQSVGWLKPEEFDEGIALFFGMPKRRVFGDETADEAQARFNRALSVAMDDESGDVSVVSHGTVIALYVSRATGFDPYRLWRRLGFPAIVTLSWPSRRLLGLIDEVR